MKKLILISFLFYGSISFAEGDRFGIAIWSTFPKGSESGATLVGQNFDRKKDVFKEPYSYFAFYKTDANSFWSNYFITASYLEHTLKDGNFDTTVTSHNVDFLLYSKSEDIRGLEYGLGAKVLLLKIEEDYRGVNVKSTYEQRTAIPLLYLGYDTSILDSQLLFLGFDVRGIVLSSRQYYDMYLRLRFQIADAFAPTLGYRMSRYQKKSDDINFDLTYDNFFLEFTF